jgi:hypothetical protein
VLDAAAILERLNRCIRELEAIRDAVAVINGTFPQPAAAANGAGEATLVRLRAAAVELGVRISGLWWS